ncbi:MAG TPA: hypothetical protein VFQ70_01800, partial [Candidatus Saccharimonadaceae bacterium]|nr:hypothetical protein [Candidatus Saccharimonadaceae bacterium]
SLSGYSMKAHKYKDKRNDAKYNIWRRVCYHYSTHRVVRAKHGDSLTVFAVIPLRSTNHTRSGYGHSV